jgi:DNA-directed RNA polymerase subunit RPC12/RpoP
MWTKYDYLCTDCDALIEVTTLQDLRRDVYGSCPCGSNKTINIGVGDASRHEEPVTNITPVRLVKINSNPYN